MPCLVLLVEFDFYEGSIVYFTTAWAYNQNEDGQVIGVRFQ